MYMMVEATMVTKPTIVATSRPLGTKSAITPSKLRSNLRVLHVHGRLGDDNYNDVHCQSANRVGDGSLYRHFESVGPLPRGGLIDRIDILVGGNRQ